MKSPKNLSHKPIISVNDYDKIDGIYANDTDARALSIGNAQYDSEQLSLKVWRKYKNEKWSRQSEELPIHRAFDLSILALASFIKSNDFKYNNGHFDIEIDEESKLEEIIEYYSENKEFLKPRIIELKKVMDEFLDRNL